MYRVKKRGLFVFELPDLTVKANEVNEDSGNDRYNNCHHNVYLALTSHEVGWVFVLHIHRLCKSKNINETHY